MQRRRFLKTCGAGGALAFMPDAIFLSPSGATLPEISNDFFKVVLNQNGSFSLYRKGNEFLLENATAGVNLKNGNYQLSSERFQLKHQIRKVSGTWGSGKMLICAGIDKNRQIDLELKITLCDNVQMIIIELITKNASKQSLHIQSLEPTNTCSSNRSSLFVTGAKKCLSNGAMYYDAGLLHEFGIETERETPYGETKGGAVLNQQIDSPSETIRSWWNASIFSGYDKECVVLGYLENMTSLGQILVSKTGKNQLAFVAESVLNPGYSLPPGGIVSSDKFSISTGDSPYTALESYAWVMSKLNKSRASSSPVNGWCSWFYTYSSVTEEEVLLNAEYAGKYLKSYGLEYIQIDEGYQRWHGDWEGNERFPQGMKWLADKIRSFGLRPGLWIAPFVVSETVGIFKENPDWFVKNDDGSPMRVGPWPSLETDWARNETPRRYCLDISHPGAANWFAKLFETISKHWGYDMIKIDFVAWSILSARNFYDASETPASLYRKGYELIRKSVKSDCHILECGPGNITTGLVDSMRIEYDQNYDNAENTWKQYFLHPSSSGPAMAKRYYFHKKTWLNDADHVCLKNLTIPQSEAVATLIAMSGGNMISGDSLINLDENKLEILKKIFPAYNETGKPIDLFDTNLPTAFAMQICKKFAEYSIVAFFNPDKESEKVWNYPLERLWLNKQNKYLVYDFWKNRYLGEITDEISVDVAPASVTLLAIHPKQSVPQFLSSDRHVLQGAIELKDFRWDATRQTLQGVSLAPVQSKTTLTVHIPSPILVNEFQSKEKDYGSWRAEFTSNEILKIHIDFSQADNITWEVPFSDFK